MQPTDRRPPFRTWRQFARCVRRTGREMLARLPAFTDPILVAGCQRSGTSLLTELLLEHPALIDYRRGGDWELEGAAILCEAAPCDPDAGRYCFQTTYLNERVGEYARQGGCFRLVWMIREPGAVVHSMCNHWKRRSELTHFALNELFDGCGRALLTPGEARRVGLLGGWAVPRLRKACLAYAGKTAQILDLAARLGPRVLVLDYDDLLQRPSAAMGAVQDFLGLATNTRGLERVRPDRRGASGLSEREERLVHAACGAVYAQVRRLSVRVGDAPSGGFPEER